MPPPNPPLELKSWVSYACQQVLPCIRLYYEKHHSAKMINPLLVEALTGFIDVALGFADMTAVDEIKRVVNVLRTRAAALGGDAASKLVGSDEPAGLGAGGELGAGAGETKASERSVAFSAASESPGHTKHRDNSIIHGHFGAASLTLDFVGTTNTLLEKIDQRMAELIAGQPKEGTDPEVQIADRFTSAWTKYYTALAGELGIADITRTIGEGRKRLVIMLAKNKPVWRKLIDELQRIVDGQDVGLADMRRSQAFILTSLQVLRALIHLPGEVEAAKAAEAGEGGGGEEAKSGEGVLNECWKRYVAGESPTGPGVTERQTKMSDLKAAVLASRMCHSHPFAARESFGLLGDLVENNKEVLEALYKHFIESKVRERVGPSLDFRPIVVIVRPITYR